MRHKIQSSAVKVRRTIEQEDAWRISALKQKRFIADGIDAIRLEIKEGHACAPLCYCGKKKAKRRW